ncbi:MAG: hypothetical protein NXY57DRAFT_961344 [Lentinula lateritia]|nr:MAG: hypothetical protein NXY57DRAFT_961344 [Lentinula lateritia]
MPAPSGPMKTPSYTVPITTFDAIQTLKLLGPFDYYPGLTPSLIAVRSGKPRLAHRLLGIDEDDIVRVRKYLEEQIAETPWFSLHLYGKPLEDIWVIIYSTWPQYDVQPNNQGSQVKTAFRLIEYTVQRFILYSVSPVGNASDFAWASPVYKECTLSHTSSISTTSRTKSEALLRKAVEGTTRELCRVLTKMWAMGVHEGLSSLFDSPMLSAHSLVRNPVLDAWKLELGNLMEWLDWNVRIRCKPACGEQELCYIPNFPFSVGDVSLPVWREDDPKPRSRYIPNVNVYGTPRKSNSSLPPYKSLCCVMYSYVEALNKVVQTHDFDVPAAVKLSPGYIGIGMAQASSKVTNYDRGFLS